MTEPTREQLKIEALSQEIAQKTNTIADLRVELTILSAEYQKVKEELDAQKEPEDASSLSD